MTRQSIVDGIKEETVRKLTVTESADIGTEASPKALNNATLTKTKVASTARGTPQEGDLKWDAAAHKLQVYNGSAWETVTSA